MVGNICFCNTSFLRIIKKGVDEKDVNIAVADFFVTLVGLIITGIIPCLNKRSNERFYYFLW